MSDKRLHKAIAILRENFARPEDILESVWALHLRDVATQILREMA